ncbi:MAG: long-chain fatty acid--CoA ligase [Desulfobacteraceae bacterium]|nr:MAG: long-chain fatty acid--CoA ligase [Desulfobacteraceae bacterium]
MNIFETIKNETRLYGDKPAVIDGNQSISYRELLDASENMAFRLKNQGIKPADRIALLCNDSIDYIIITLAILAAKAAVVPVSPSLSWDETDSVLNRIDINYLIYDKPSYPGTDSAQFFSGFNDGGEFFLLSRKAKDLLPEEYYAMNPAFIRFSSGTTGGSKGVLLSHESIIERTDAADRALLMTPDDVVIWVLSMSYHFVVTILLFLRRASTIVICGNAFPESFIENIKIRKGTFTYASPFHYHMLSNSAGIPSDLFSGIRLAVSTAMKLPQLTAGEFSDKFGLELSEAYGIIEVGLPFINLSGNPAKRGSAGIVLPDYSIKIENMDREGVGELFIKGKGLIDAYCSPWNSRKSLLSDGWFNTGDLGRIDGDGFLYIFGRDKNVINFAGMKIFPEDVESVLNRHPFVKESLVYGIPHPRYGELPCAKVVLKEETAPGFDTDEIRRFCYPLLASYKVPKEITPVTTLEKTASGKIRRWQADK